MSTYHAIPFVRSLFFAPTGSRSHWERDDRTVVTTHAAGVNGSSTACCLHTRYIASTLRSHLNATVMRRRQSALLPMNGGEAIMGRRNTQLTLRIAACGLLLAASTGAIVWGVQSSLQANASRAAAGGMRMGTMPTNSMSMGAMATNAVAPAKSLQSMAPMSVTQLVGT